jgi:hypothetical protein
MKNVKYFALIVLVIAILAMTISPLIVRADWNPEQSAKFVQLPDLNTTGMDVNATWLYDITQPPTTPPQPIYPYQKILADDFLCTQTGPITDVHIWGSWLGDRFTNDVRFKLSIHSDVPAGTNNPYSHPGDILWSQIFSASQFLARPYATAEEVFYEPNTKQIIGRDTQVWQYNFNIDPAKAFVQQGTAALPMVYWLDVQAIVPQAPPPAGALPEFVFGWKTSLQHWNDDAVFGDTLLPGGDPVNPTGGPVWYDMRYPEGHVLFPQSIDMAFVITPEPSTLVLLFAACLFGLMAYIRRR